jgi:shikimate kinase
MAVGRADHLVLVGMMGVGKTTTGRALAERLAWPLRDSDVDLRTRTGLSGAEIVARHGVDHLHRLEEEVLLRALQIDGPAIITAAGSVVASVACRRALRSRAVVVWLDAPVTDMLARMAANDHRRPLSRTDLVELLARRRTYLKEVSDLRVDARASTAELVDQVLRFLDDERTVERPRRAEGGQGHG